LAQNHTKFSAGRVDFNPFLDFVIMKKFFATILFSAAILLVANFASAVPLFGSLSTITTATTNSATFLTNTAAVYMPQVTISNNGLAITNAYTGAFRFSIDNGSTWFTNNSPIFTPTSTNAASYTIAGQVIQIPILIQLSATTNAANTTTIQLGATSP
jgi:hypothetical protein